MLQRWPARSLENGQPAETGDLTRIFPNSINCAGSSSKRFKTWLYICYFLNLIFLVAAPPRVALQHYRAIDVLSKPFHKTIFCPTRQRGIRDSIEVGIPACHAEGPGSIPGRGKFRIRGLFC